MNEIQQGTLKIPEKLASRLYDVISHSMDFFGVSNDGSEDYSCLLCGEESLDSTDIIEHKEKCLGALFVEWYEEA